MVVGGAVVPDVVWLAVVADVVPCVVGCAVVTDVV